MCCKEIDCGVKKFSYKITFAKSHAKQLKKQWKAIRSNGNTMKSHRTTDGNQWEAIKKFEKQGASNEQAMEKQWKAVKRKESKRWEAMKM